MSDPGESNSLKFTFGDVAIEADLEDEALYVNGLQVCNPEFFNRILALIRLKFDIDSQIEEDFEDSFNFDEEDFSEEAAEDTDDSYPCPDDCHCHSADSACEPEEERTEIQFKF